MNRPFGQQKRRLSWFMLVLILALMVSGVGYANYVAPLQAKSEAEGLSILVIEAKQLVKVQTQSNTRTVSPAGTAVEKPESQVGATTYTPTDQPIQTPQQQTEEAKASSEPAVDNTQSEETEVAENEQLPIQPTPSVAEQGSKPTDSENHFTVTVEAGSLNVGGQGLVPGVVNYYELKLYNPSDKVVYLSKDLSAKVVSGNRPRAFLERVASDHLSYELLENDLSIRPKTTKTYVLRLSVSPELPECFVSQGQNYAVEGALLKLELGFVVKE